jgi:hypothetical protein
VKRLWAALLLAPILAAATPFADRARSVIESGARNRPPNAGYDAIAAKLYLHEDAAWCSTRLRELLAEGPTGDMFWMFPVTAIAYLDRGQLSAEARQALRRAWKTYMPYRGDTENHWLLYYTSLYLMAQLWPDEPGGEWYTGKSSAENLREAGGWIDSWVKLTTRRGQGEYDSPQYMAMMLDYLIADYAAENLDGLYVSAHSRVYERALLEKASATSTDFGWVLFGLGHHPQPVSGYVLYYLLAGGYEPPEILQRIASDRSRPYTHYERKRTRNRWRFFDELHGPVYKTTYVRREYAVASDQGGVLQPIQQHSWGVTWSVPDARGVQNTFFTLHPYSEWHELQTYFTFGPDGAVEDIIKSKPTYDSPDKLLGGSPYEKILQDEDALIALYDIPRGTRFPHINGFYSKDLAEVTEDPSGWIFARGGEALIACRPLQPYTWKPIDGGGRRLFSPFLRNGVIVQVAAAQEFGGIDSFRQAIRALPLEYNLDSVPSVRFRSLRGRELRFLYGQPPAVDGKPLDYAAWPLFGGPFLEAAVDSEKLVMKQGRLRRTLDFKKLTISDE